MTTAFRPPRIVMIAMIGVWLLVGLGGVTSYGVAYWVHRGFAAPSWPTGVPHGTLRQVSFHSASLGRKESYTVYLPPGYAAAARSGQRFGVLYLLHGSPGTPKLLYDVSGIGPRVDTLEHKGAIKPMILVLPRGSDGTFHNDTEWADSPHGRYGSFVTDVVHHVDAHFATHADRRWRALAGISEGAYGALNLTLTHLPLFATAESWSGYYSQTPTGPFATASSAQVAAASPAQYVSGLGRALARYPTHMLVYNGRHDHYLDVGAFRSFTRGLSAAGADVSAHLLAGGHTWRLWRREIPYALDYFSRHMGVGAR